MKCTCTLLALALIAPGCGSDDGKSAATNTNYDFQSRFQQGSSVVYDGQVARHQLIRRLTNTIGAITDTTYTAQSVLTLSDDLNAVYSIGTAQSVANLPLYMNLAGGEPTAQQTLGDFGVNVSLQQKMPEVDAGFVGGVQGYGTGSMAPHDLVQSWFDELEALVADRIDGSIPTDPDGFAIAKSYVTATGIDYQQLIQKFLLGAVPFSQGTDDYLDDDTPGKGLLADNTAAVQKNGETLAYTELEHAWDEAFGYFGAARDYPDYTDDEIAGKGGRPDYEHGYHDSNGDGFIDLAREYNSGHSTNAAKRDRGSAGFTDFTQEAFGAFHEGRSLITQAGGALSEGELISLKVLRDAAALAWEKSIAATVVHYINELLQDMNAYGSSSYSFADQAKHFSELKGFALSLQFNPRSPMAQNFVAFHNLVGDAPVLPNATGAEAYKSDLNAAKQLMMDAYQFPAPLAGDAAGNGGW